MNFCYRKNIKLANSNYKSNTAWLVLSKVYRVILSMLMTMVIARYLGPELFGIYSFSLSFCVVFSILVTLGLESLVVKELFLGKKSDLEIVYTGFLIRVLGGFFFLCVANFFVRVINLRDDISIWLVFIISISYFLRCFDVFRYWFEGRIKGRVPSIIDIFGVSVAAIGRLFCVFYELPIYYFAVLILVEQLIISLAIYVTFYLELNESCGIYIFDKTYSISLIRQSLPLAFAGGLYMLYSKIDQFMILKMINTESLGIYSAAVQISEGWFFIPTAIAAALFPKILEAKARNSHDYIYVTQKILYLMSAVGIGAAIVISFSSQIFIPLLFGPHYKDSILILIIHVWGGVFVAINAISSKYLVAEGLQKFSFYRGGAGVIFNILLNFIFIPKFGLIGAAISTVVSQFIALYALNIFSSKTRKMFMMQSKSLVFYDYLFRK